MSAGDLTVHVMPLEVTHGLWCEQHALPHRSTITLLFLSDHGVTQGQPLHRCDTDPQEQP